MLFFLGLMNKAEEEERRCNRCFFLSFVYKLVLAILEKILAPQWGHRYLQRVDDVELIPNLGNIPIFIRIDSTPLSNIISFQLFQDLLTT